MQYVRGGGGGMALKTVEREGEKNDSSDKNKTRAQSVTIKRKNGVFLEVRQPSNANHMLILLKHSVSPAAQPSHHCHSIDIALTGRPSREDVIEKKRRECC